MKRVLVLGCGPAGLLAAHAARQHGHAVEIASVRRYSHLFGCQYLHEPIPDTRTAKVPGHTVAYRLDGDAEGYRRKVYGSLTPPVSPQRYAGNHLAWDLRQCYDELWARYSHLVGDMLINPENAKRAITSFAPHLVVSSIPLPSLCQKGSLHNFQSVTCWAIGDAPELGQSVPFAPREDFTVICDGTPDTSWYRMSRVYGYATVEWPGSRRRPPLTGVSEFKKPLTTDCDCLPEIVRVGRYGRWEKGVLAHDAYSDTVKALAERGMA